MRTLGAARLPAPGEAAQEPGSKLSFEEAEAVTATEQCQRGGRSKRERVPLEEVVEEKG